MNDKQSNTEGITLTFTGDIGFDKYMSDKWKDKELISEDIRDIFRASDHVIINVEGAIINRADATLRQVSSVEEQMLHTIDPDAVPFLRELPADIWTISNNHIMDAGAAGLKSTLDLADKYSVRTVGAGMDKNEAARPIYIDMNDDTSRIPESSDQTEPESPDSLKSESQTDPESPDSLKSDSQTDPEFPDSLPHPGGIGLFSVCYRPDCVEADDTHAGCISWADMDTISNIIKEIKGRCRWCIVIAHGGEEFTSLPSPYTRDRYLKYLELGADIVVGHHPHVPMNYEIVPVSPDGATTAGSDLSGMTGSESQRDPGTKSVKCEGEKLIIYSLGNFIFDTDYQRSQLNTDRGIILTLSFTKDSYSFKAYGTRLDRTVERIGLYALPEIFEDVPPDEYEKLAPLSAKAFVAATKKQYTYLYPAIYTDADDDKWMECFMDPERDGRMPGEALDFEVVLPLALKADKEEWKKSRLEGVKKYILDQL